MPVPNSLLKCEKGNQKVTKSTQTLKYCIFLSLKFNFELIHNILKVSLQRFTSVNQLTFNINKEWVLCPQNCT